MVINHKQLKRSKQRRAKAQKAIILQRYSLFCCEIKMIYMGNVVDEIGNSFVLEDYKGTAQRRELWVCTTCKKTRVVGISKGHHNYK